jgi:hypothetical protein
MKIDYALFDPSSDQGGGNYWTWSADDLPPVLRDLLYRQFAVKHLHPDVNVLSGETLWGGIVHIAAETASGSGRVVLYRYFNGGRDRKNRPGRYVMLTAWLKADDIKTVSGHQIFGCLRPVFDTAVFQHVLDHCKELPIPAPAVLSENFSLPLPPADGSETFADNRFHKHIKIENSEVGAEKTESAAYIAWKEEQSRKNTTPPPQENEKPQNGTEEEELSSRPLERQLMQARQRAAELEEQVQRLKRRLMFCKLIILGLLVMAAVILTATALRLNLPLNLPPEKVVRPVVRPLSTDSPRTPSTKPAEAVKPH